LGSVPDPYSGVVGQLDSFGPGCACGCSESEARAYCVALARAHPENFAVLSRVVPADLREDFACVYAFCRWADDLADEGAGECGGPDERLRLLSWWGDRLASMAGGEPDHPVMVALAPTVERHGLGTSEFEALLGAFRLDQTKTRYETWDELLGYCAGSANPVGHLVLMMGGVRSPEEDASSGAVWAKSDAVCTALQITNHVQDVRRDLLERDRVYMPRNETGLDAQELRDLAGRGDEPAARIRFITALRPLVERTWPLFEQGRRLIPTLDPSIRPVVWLFGAGGERVLRKVDHLGCTTLWSRPRLRGTEKALLVGRAGIMRLIYR